VQPAEIEEIPKGMTTVTIRFPLPASLPIAEATPDLHAARAPGRKHVDDLRHRLPWYDKRLIPIDAA